MSTTTSLLHTALQNLHVAQQVAHPSHTPRPPSSRSSPTQSRRNGDASSDDEEYVRVGQGTAPGTPIPGKGMVLGQRIKKDNGARDPVSLVAWWLIARSEWVARGTLGPHAFASLCTDVWSYMNHTRTLCGSISTVLVHVDAHCRSVWDIVADSQLRTFPTHVAVRIFLQLDIRSLARCDRVCKRWNKSSTLNYSELHHWPGAAMLTHILCSHTPLPILTSIAIRNSAPHQLHTTSHAHCSCTIYTGSVP